jgi:hypothetical protein
MIKILISGILTKSPQERQLVDGRTMAKAQIVARISKERNETWTVLAYANVKGRILHLREGDAVSVSGVPCIEIGPVNAESRILRSVVADTVIALRDGGLADE